jgi:hypothetical protein
MKNEFADHPVISDWQEKDVIAKLKEFEDETLQQSDIAPETSASTAKGSITEWFQKKRPIWYSNSHVFGFLSEPEENQNVVNILDVGAHPADETLQNSRINISLNYLRIADYPGSGTHRVLFDFYAKHNLGNADEEVHFNATYRVMEGERAGIRGYPIFIGLNVGTQGLAFRCYTVNVSNNDDEAFLRRLDSEVFQSGLKMATVAQPAIAPLTSMAVALTKSIAERNRNVPVQDFFLGLDFTKNPGGGRLAKGSYVVVQVPEESVVVWNWNEWVFDVSLGQIVNIYSPSQLIPYNYIIFGVSEYKEPKL